MAQAPGPGVGASSIQTIGPNDTAINSDPIGNFETTWTKDWTPISRSGGSSIKTVPSSGSSSSGLSTGAKAGIGGGACLMGFALIGTALCLFIRMRRRKQNDPREQQNSPSPEYEYHTVQEKDADTLCVGDKVPDSKWSQRCFR